MKAKIIITILLAFTLNSKAQYTMLHAFPGLSNSYDGGARPNGDLFFDGTFLYGMTSEGGLTPCPSGCGTIFKVKPDGTEYSILLNFSGTTDGKSPRGSFISDGTYLYGSTGSGGINNMGTIFKIKPDGSGYSKLLDFDGTTNGNNPGGSFISDGTYLYGMTNSGGVNNLGVIFKIKPDGTAYSKILDFSGIAHGSNPGNSLISDGTYLYGMTSSGGTNGYGVIFKVKPDGTGFSKLLDFSGTANGRRPFGSLISDGTYLYGMTLNGGTGSSCGSFGCGVLFKIKFDGTGFSKLTDFVGTNGLNPWGSLISYGTFLYGMTYYGGINNNGVIFKIKPDGTGYFKLNDFMSSINNQGSNPIGSLNSDGNYFYGMTSFGGQFSQGTIFKMGLAIGINEQNIEIGFNFSPNPFTNQTIISFEEEQRGIVIKVFDLLGNVIKVQTFTGKELVLEKGEMANGIYFVQVIDEMKNIANKKIVIQ